MRLEPKESNLAMTMPGIARGHQLAVELTTVEVNGIGHLVLKDEVLETNESVRDTVDVLNALADGIVNNVGVSLSGFNPE